MEGWEGTCGAADLGLQSQTGHLAQVWSSNDPDQPHDWIRRRC